ncbi:MAG: hypothetical protein U0165_08830 [Polyangiaceae bacterium]
MRRVDNASVAIARASRVSLELLHERFNLTRHCKVEIMELLAHLNNELGITIVMARTNPTWLRSSIALCSSSGKIEREEARSMNSSRW